MISIIFSVFFVLSLFLSFIWLKIGGKFSIYEPIYGFSHAKEVYKKKKNTVTLGGFIIFLSVLISLFFIKIDKNILAILLGCFLLGLVGFIDDYIKIKRKSHHGLNKIQKLFFQIMASIILLCFLYKFNLIKTYIFVPLFNINLDLNYFYYFFIILFIVFIVNSVNITDGLDGLAIGCFIIVLLALALITYNFNFLNLFYFEIILISTCLGFLIFNFNPAKIFLGGIGSYILGAILALTVIILKQELIFFIMGFVFVLEGSGSLVSIFNYRILKRKRLLFLIPHHALQFLRIPEKQIVFIIWILTTISSLFGLMIYF